MAEVFVHGDAHKIECTVTVAGESHEIFFRSELPVLAPNGDIGVALSILPSMRAREDLIVQSPVSGSLLRNIQHYQEIVSTWYPELVPIGVKANVADRTSGERIASFFSGGADSFYTALKHRETINDWILVRGFDISLEVAEDHLWSLTRDAAARAADEAGSRLVEIESNLRQLLQPGAQWGPRFHGVGMASVGLAMRHNVGKLLIPSSHTYRNLSPYGSHPLLDPLWGGDGLEVVHDGADMTRVAKVRAISECPAAMKYLRVCCTNVPNRYNCGECEKCLRTAVNLYAVGALERCETLPDRLDLRAIRRQFFASENGRAIVQENLDALDNTKENLAVRRALKRTIGRRIPYRARRMVYQQLRSASNYIPSRARRRVLDLLRQAL